MSTQSQGSDVDVIYGGRWGRRVAVAENGETVPPTVLGFEGAQEFSDAGRGEAAEAVQELYADEDSPYSPPGDDTGDTIHFRREVGPVHASAEDRKRSSLRATLEEQGLDEEAVENALETAGL